MAERIKFYFDPGCPWCYMTSKWAKRLEELGEVELSWGIFSLEVQNADKEAVVTELTGRSAEALRTAVLLRELDGEKAVGKFYSALGTRFWDGSERLNDAETIRAALSDAGADPGIYDKAIADEETTKTIIAEHKDAAARYGAFGVPTIVLDAGDGPSFFGPVIREMPSDEDAVELFKHTVWMTRYTNFAELKRGRGGQPDLEAIRRFVAARQQQQQQTSS